MSMSDELHTIANGFAGFLQHVPAELQPAFNDLIRGAHTLADTAVTTEVNKVAGPMLSPLVLPLVLNALDGLVNELTNYKASLTN